MPNKSGGILEPIESSCEAAKATDCRVNVSLALLDDWFTECFK
jgi:hypothetical protein